jgi:molecular chaperone Hsp33
MSDMLYRGIIEDLDVRFSYAVTQAAANKAVLAHGCDPIAAHPMVRALTAAVLSAPLLTDDERLTIHWNYDGAIRSLLMDVGAESDVRGFINPTNLSQFAESEDEVFGESCVVKVTKSSSQALLNNGQTNTPFGDPVADLAYTYCLSDQVESGMSVMVGFAPDPDCPVAISQGIFIQALPHCDLVVFDELRKRLDSDLVREYLRCPPVHDNWFEDILKALTDDDNCRMTVTECPAPKFKCNCSMERMLDAIRTLPDDQRKDVIAKGEELKVTCHFCNTQHVIPIDIIKSVFGEK